MEQSEGGEQSQRRQQQPWGKLIRLGADEAEPHVLLLKREWTIGRKKGGTGTRRRAGFGGQQRSPLLAFKTVEGGLKLVGFGGFSCWMCLPDHPLCLIYLLALCDEEVLH